VARLGIDQYYIQMTLLAAKRAGCPKRNVGAIIVDNKHRVLSIGYNSPPRNLPTCHEVPCGGETEGGTCISAHAEISAICACRDIHAAHTIYISCSPCVACTQAVMSTPIKRLVFAEFHKTWNISKTIWTGEWELIAPENN